MASLDLGTLKVGVKVDGAEQAKSVLEDVGQAAKGADESAKSSSGGFKGLGDTFKSVLGDTKLFGIDLGSLTGSLGSAGGAAGLLGGVMGGALVLGVQAAITAIQGLITKIGEFIASSVQMGTDFQAQMSRVTAITGETEEGLKELTEVARQFGSDTVFSTQEVAKAMEYMGMAGWDAQQTMEGMSGVLDLAAASGEDLALVSDTVTDVLTALGEEADQAGRMADVFAAAATNSNTNVGKMAYTMKYAAPIAGALSYSMEDLSIATGLMANAGIKGETAGTALRSMFTELRGDVVITSEAMGDFVVSTENADGSMKPFRSTMDSLREAFSGLTDSEKAANAEALVGKEAMSGLLAIVNAGTDDYNKLTQAIDGSTGAADQMAGVMTDNVFGVFEEIGGKFEDLKISLFTAFEPLIRGLSEIFNEFLGTNVTGWKVLGDVLNSTFSMFEPLFAWVTQGFRVLGEAFKAVADIVMELVGPMLDNFTDKMGDGAEGIETFADIVVGGIEIITNVLIPLADIIGNVLGAFQALITLNFDQLEKHITSLMDTLTGNADKANKTMEDSAENHYDTMEGMAKEHGEVMTELSKLSQDAMNKELSDYEKKLKETYDETTRSGRQAIEKRLDNKKEELEKSYRMEEEHYRKVAELQKRLGVTDTVTSGWSGGITNRYANGTLSAQGGWSVVGETGRELMYTEPKSKIISNSQTEKMLGGTTITGNTFVIQANNYQEFVDSMEQAVISGEW